MDAGGIKAAKPIYEKAGTKFQALVDPQNALSEAFGFDLIPNGFLIDEACVLKYKKVGGFEVRSPATIKVVEEFLSQPPSSANAADAAISDLDLEHQLRAKLKADPAEGQLYLDLGKLLLRSGRPAEAAAPLTKAAELMPKSSSARFNLGTALLATDQKDNAVARFKEALRLDRNNFVIRKQIWLMEHPEKFHPTIDWDWQREQLKKERKQEKSDPPPG